MAVESGGYQDYDTYQQVHSYTSAPGIVQLPVASRSSGVRLIRLHGGVGTRVVNFTAARHGRPPVLPSPVNLSADTLLSSGVSVPLPRPNTRAGGFDWVVTGTYVYSQNNLRTPGTDNLPTGEYPFALPVQTSMAEALDTTVSSQNRSPVTLGNAIIDHVTGSYIWPYTDLPPISFSKELIL